MRKILISLLLAGAAATPAIAGPHDWSDQQSAQQDRQSAREDRQAAREERAQERADSRAERSSNVERPQFARPVAVAPQAQSFSGGERVNVRPNRGNFAGQSGGYGATTYVAPGPRMVNAPTRQDREELRNQRIQDRQLRQSERVVPNVMRDRHPLEVSSVPRPGTQPPLRAQSRVQWNTNWRNDGHHDWHRYRDHHRSRFHLGLYYDPFGWGYQRFSIGYRMWPAYYGNQFWIDPAMFGLPFPPPGAAWVRYWNDAVLVDVYTGTVLDVIPGFFW